MNINDMSFSKFTDTACDIVENALFLPGNLPFDFNKVDDIFDADNVRLTNNLKWVFEATEESGMAQRMRLVLAHHSEQYRSIQSLQDKHSYALQVVKLLKGFYI